MVGQLEDLKPGMDEEILERRLAAKQKEEKEGARIVDYNIGTASSGLLCV